MPVVEGITSGGLAAGGTSDTLTYPSGIQSTDLVFCVIGFKNTTTVANTLTPPTGYTTVTGSTLTTAAVAGSHNMWAGFRQGTGGGTSLSMSAANLDSWAIYRLSGAVIGQPEQISFGTNGASTSTMTIAGKSLSTVSAGALVINAYGARTASNAIHVDFTPDAATTEGSDYSRAAGGTVPIYGMETVYETQAGAGANTTRTATAVLSTAGNIFPLSSAWSIADSAVAAGHLVVRRPLSGLIVR